MKEDAADDEDAAEDAYSKDYEVVVVPHVDNRGAGRVGDRRRVDGEEEEGGSRETRRCSVERAEDGVEIPRPGRNRSLVQETVVDEVDEGADE